MPSALATLFGLADGGGARLGQGTAHRGQGVLRAGGAEFGLDLPPAGQGRRAAARGDRVDLVVRDLDNQLIVAR